MNSDITYLGRVINVNSGSVEVEICKEIPSAAPIINGRLYKIGQIGTFVKFPVGNLTLFGLVSSVSNTPASIENVEYEPNYGSRFLQVQLIGEKLGNDSFEKGIGTFPTINDEVHLVTEDDLRQIYGVKSNGFIEVGKHASSENLPVFLSLHNLVLRHSAILGSTGSGKSNATANIIKRILEDNTGSRIVLVDTHGEYPSAFDKKAKVFKINDPESPLCVPYWMMSFDELSFFLVGRTEGQEKPEDKQLREKILELKKANCTILKAGAVNEDYVTADSPIPFDIKKMWYDFDRELNATYNHNSEHTTANECLEEEGDPATLRPAKFTPYSSNNTAPFRSKKQTMYPYVGKIYSRIKDSRYSFMFNPPDYSDATSKHDLDELLRNWIGNEERLTILDLSGIPFELIDISVGLISRFLYDSMYWGRFDEYTGRGRPLLMVYEEAHSYLPRSERTLNVYGYARKAVEKIFKEGRKFGIGAMVVTQRPSEISETILAQIGTFIALRLTNSGDKNTVQSSAPNNMNSLIELLPSLRIGEAIVVGEAINIPSRVRINLVDPRPSSNDPDLSTAWHKTFIGHKDDYKSVVLSIREQKIVTKTKK
ncbi:ATP-binding protein [Mucilaginibacter sp. UR6-11]|uniref:ATP-binding protein n=1 Tax=Mucilaginibacter sp. UR6-11 TaxID=1435644 RepID=UPI001E303A27|nr:ATP-binding protein [Mucilaginibacter sp. UR6-11]MCC8427085.1 ATP-binding protein [Mucilaginibacter sp. UR6-11]